MNTEFFCHNFLFLLLSFLRCNYLTYILNYLKATNLIKSGKMAQKNVKEMVKFKYHRDHIFLRVKLNDNPNEYLFMLDTAAPTMISNEIVQGMGLKSVVSAVGRDVSGAKCGMPLFKIRKLNINGVTFEDIGAGAMDFAKTSDELCLKVDGIIGSNLLRHCITEIDFKDSTLTISDKAESLPELNGGYRLHFRTAPLDGFAPVFPCSLNGKIKVKIKLDTGADGVISIPLSTFEKVGQPLEGEEVIEGWGTHALGAFGTVGEVYLTRLKKIQLGNMVFENVLTKVGGKECIIGNEFLKNFLVRLNYSRNEAILFPYPDAKIPNNYHVFGFGWIYEDGKTVIRFLWDKSPAAKAGIKLGDEILSINDRYVVGLSKDEVCKVRSEIGKAETLKLLLSGEGVTKSVVLQKADLLP